MTEDELIEKMAWAGAKVEGGPVGTGLFCVNWSEFGELYERTMRAALAELTIPPSALLSVINGESVIVPVEPTNEMLGAAQSAWYSDPLRRTTTMYHAMIAARPCFDDERT